MANHDQLDRLVDPLPDIYVRYELALREVDYFALPLRDRKVELLRILNEERINTVNTIEFRPVLEWQSEIKQCTEFINTAILTVRFSSSTPADLESVNSRIYFLRLRLQRLKNILPSNRADDYLPVQKLFGNLTAAMNTVNVPMTDAIRELANYFDRARVSDVPNCQRLSDVSPPFLGFGSCDLNRPNDISLPVNVQAVAHNTNPFVRLLDYADDLFGNPNRNGANLNVSPNNDRFLRQINNGRSTPIPNQQCNNNNNNFEPVENSFYRRPAHIDRHNDRDSQNRERIWQWNLKFTGDNSDMSASEFLQLLMDRCMSRNVSREDILHCMFDLLGGTALRWYRSRMVSRPFRDWDEFVRKFLEDFEPFHQNDGLLEAIRKRKQFNNESIVKFFATVEDMFWRLHNVPPERERIAIIRKNLLPRFIEKLSLHHFDTVEALKDACKMAEYGFKLAVELEPSAVSRYPQAHFNRNFNNINAYRQPNYNRGAPVQFRNNFQANINATPRSPQNNGNNNQNFVRINANNFRQRTDNFVDNRGRPTNTRYNVNTISNEPDFINNFSTEYPQYDSALPPNFCTPSQQPYSNDPFPSNINSSHPQTAWSPEYHYPPPQLNGYRAPSAQVEPSNFPPPVRTNDLTNNVMPTMSSVGRSSVEVNNSENITGTLNRDTSTVPEN